ncbi:hypothetical protein THRCLA_21143 [Thraustotheca clavata]|uniref:Uncharacterized protein n=1 Tax=Thraustotheca clavata TaxID=74557 RepID=A0A1V9ZZY7_9STRA|nr:hypothetical protein THRCLA_21143 [Thraustotheca clavata]
MLSFNLHTSQENIPKTGRILYVGYYSIHIHDLFPIGVSIYKVTGELPRSLFHRIFILLLVFRHWGCIAGTQNEAIKSYNEGYNCICMLGGGEEAVHGFENESFTRRQRQGFAELALEFDATIALFVTRNGEEMVFNIIGLSRLYEQLLTLPKPSDGTFW